MEKHFLVQCLEYSTSLIYVSYSNDYYQSLQFFFFNFKARFTKFLGQAKKYLGKQPLPFTKYIVKKEYIKCTQSTFKLNYVKIM